MDTRPSNGRRIIPKKSDNHVRIVERSPYQYCYTELNGLDRCRVQCDLCKIYYRHLE